MTDCIFLQGLRVRTIIGVYPHEREKAQEIVLHITLFTDLHHVAATDDLAGGVDYAAVAERVRAHVEAARRFTVEALAEDVARLCLDVEGVARVRVRVEKPGAVPGVDAVGVEIERP